ncbi:HAD family hydrolase [Lysobacter oculi]|uniref:HAD family hydrolase n=1 Tax=Solilutibacter oculi TaxID=2698682 RepID=A0A344J2U1_9GAMM|nr:HAD hydrolase-like protein [Lysobacter oculi]AXA83351.1 HAD family hydrolase [Lysobacter oculi]
MLFFDLDGTLIDSSVGVTRCIAYSLERMGHAGLPQAELLGWIGPALRVSYATLFDDPADIARAEALYHERFDREGIPEFAVYPGIPEALQALHARGERMAVVTAKNEPQARRIIESLPFGQLFEDVIGASAEGHRSHKPELIAEALHRFGIAARHCSMTGDRHMDMEGAHHHGMRAVGVLWGFGGAEELREAGADALVAHPREWLQAWSVDSAAGH